MGKTVNKWNISVIISFVLGTAIAVTLTLLKPAQENSSLIYLLISGVVATCSMILPGLSGSFVLILLGNYQLVMIDAVNDLNFNILIPVVIGAVIGLVLFANILTWVFKKFRDQTISILTGFILGSLGVIWPWKTIIPAKNSAGEIIIKKGEQLIEGYNWYLPESFSNASLEMIFAPSPDIF